MDVSAASRRFLVVTTNFVVAEDLKEILESFADSAVDACSSVDEMRDVGYDLAILDGSLNALQEDRRIDTMRSKGTKFIILGGALSEIDNARSGFTMLAQPFRTGDVLALLDRLGLRRP